MGSRRGYECAVTVLARHGALGCGLSSPSPYPPLAPHADVLEKHTEYEGYRKDDPTVILFWKVFRSLSNEDRALFVRFAWGRCVW